MSVEDRQLIKHFRTTGVTEPVASAITEGELALSMDNTNPKMFFKKNDGTMATFVDKNYVDSGDTLLTEVTYTQLKTLVDNSELVPGMKYRITDYVCTTTQGNTQSAGHQFDIIVIADDVNVLNENAFAIKHSGDTYFENCDLSAWELKYSLMIREDKLPSVHLESQIQDCNDYLWHKRDSEKDFSYNGTDYYAWTDENGWTIYTESTDVAQGDDYYYYWYLDYNNSTSDTSVGDDTIDVYIDDYGDYLTFTRHSSEDQVKNPLDGSNGDNYYAWYNSDEDMIGYTYSSEPEDGDEFMYDVNDFYFDSSDSVENAVEASSASQIANYRGIITYMKDEHSNELPYDFKNIMFKRYKITSCTKVPDLVNKYYGIKNGYSYEIDEEDYKYVFTFGGEIDETLNGVAYNNVIRVDNNGSLNNITFGSNSYSNKFEGVECYNNTFGNYFQQNTFGNSIGYNTFGNDVYSNTFGNSCQENTFGNSCYGNTFGNYCYYNTFGNYCYRNTFGNNVYSNTFGNDYIRWSWFGNGVQYCNLSGYTTGSNSYLQNIHVLEGTQGTNTSNRLNLSGLSTRTNYSLYIGKDSTGTLRVKCPMDIIL